MIIIILISPIILGFVIAMTRFMDRTFTGWLYNIKMWKYRTLSITLNMVRDEIKRQKKQLKSTSIVLMFPNSHSFSRPPGPDASGRLPVET